MNATDKPEPTTLHEFIRAGAWRIQQRNEWMDRLAAHPLSATSDDIAQLVSRVRMLEKDATDMYEGGYCTCFARAAMMHDRLRKDQAILAASEKEAGRG